MRSCTTLLALTLLTLAAGILATARLAGGSSRTEDGRAEGPPSYRSRNFEVATYGRVEAQARSTVGVARRADRRVMATGVLIAPDLVLTCRHATHVHSADDRRHAPRALEVQLYEGAGRTRSHPVQAYAYTSETHDVCVLRIGPDEQGRRPGPDRVQRLSSERVGLGAPLYVLHHPHGGTLQVADDARVLFPYRATEAELDRVRARLRAEGDRGGEDARALETSYRPASGGERLNFSSRWAWQPVIGADCATYDGSSGAPVFAKSTHALIGMLFAGGDPSRRGRRTSWSNHEAILPAEVIAAELEHENLLPR